MYLNFIFYLLCLSAKIHTLMNTATRGSVFCPWTLWCADWTPPAWFLQHIVSLHSCFVLLEVSSAGVQHMHEQILNLHRH